MRCGSMWWYKNMSHKKIRVRLNVEMLYFQDINIDKDEAIELEELLKEFGWSNIEKLMEISNLNREESTEAVNGLIDKGVVWWTRINGKMWYAMKPMTKKERRQWDKAFKQKGLKNGKLRKRRTGGS